MDSLGADIRLVAPTDPEILPLISTHLKLMHASSPACSVHAMDASDLADADAQFFAAYENNTPVAMGALKKLSSSHGELKSMHVRERDRGRGLADAILIHLLDAARNAGLKKVSLETGSQDAFAPARSFYARHGFAECPPFEGYELDPNSVFMTRTL
ncbi:MAG: GNAT family N-acetyltransferase [Paracoccaceae bacterium]